MMIRKLQAPVKPKAMLLVTLPACPRAAAPSETGFSPRRKTCVFYIPMRVRYGHRTLIPMPWFWPFIQTYPAASSSGVSP